MTTRKAVFLSFAFFIFVLTVPRLCAQEIKMSPSEAAVTRQKLVDYSKQFIGKPYASGGIGPNSFDCSGLVFTVSRESIGIQLPRTTRAIYNFCKEIDEDSREAGDLVFFKTTSSGNVSHVGIYIGGTQFIHAASDGPNTGVIVSSLKESYWKAHYFATRRYLPASNSELLSVSPQSTEKPKSTERDEKTGKNEKTNYRSVGSKESNEIALVPVKSGGFLENIFFDSSISADWSVLTPDSLKINWRGFDTMVHVRYAGKYLQPGLGSYFRFDTGTKNFQFPFVLTFAFKEFFQIYAGPVLSLRKPSLPKRTHRTIKNSVFPGIFGFSFYTPSLEIGKLLFSLFQDIHYTVFTNTDGKTLSAKNSVAAGLVFSTGLRVTLPLKNML